MWLGQSRIVWLPQCLEERTWGTWVNEAFGSTESYDITTCKPLQWRHNEHNGVSNHQPHDCLLKRWFRLRSKKTSKLRVTGLCEGNSPATGEFPAQMASNAENIFIWWCRHDKARRNRILISWKCSSDPQHRVVTYETRNSFFNTSQSAFPVWISYGNFS